MKTKIAKYLLFADIMVILGMIGNIEVKNLSTATMLWLVPLTVFAFIDYGIIKRRKSKNE